jgi:U3 small nucleolar RNA-associated protein 12
MVKAYLRYEHTGAFGVVSSGPVVADASGKHLIAAALENVVLWSLKAGQAVSGLQPCPPVNFLSPVISHKEDML